MPSPYRKPLAFFGNKLRTFVALGATLGTLVACSESTPLTAPSDADSFFTADISGAILTRLEGPARSTGIGGGEPGWNIDMTTATASGAIGIIVDGMPRPPEDTYIIASALEHGGNAPNNEFTAIVGLTSPTSSFGSISGTLTITESTATNVSGTFAFTAEDPLDETRTVMVQGSFRTVNQDLPTP
ncbi:MAG: hypothetical protein ACR2QM_15715 [Longimicrobiales bacterium]